MFVEAIKAAGTKNRTAVMAKMVVYLSMNVSVSLTMSVSMSVRVSVSGEW